MEVITPEEQKLTETQIDATKAHALAGLIEASSKAVSALSDANIQGNAVSTELVAKAAENLVDLTTQARLMYPTQMQVKSE